MKYVGFIHNSSSNNELYGGKGSKLIKIAKLGINVPPGFIMNTKSYKTFIKESKFKDEIFSTFSEEYMKDEVLTISKRIIDYILNSKIPKTIRIELKKAYRKLRKESREKTSFAVRSSANIEDSKKFSFAGQAESFLNNRSFKDIMKSLKKCWASLFSPQALLYLLHMKKKGTQLSLSDIEIAVVIQKMIFPECSGVLFTTNVINNNKNQMMINSTWGLGDVVTNNSINPDLIIIDKLNGTIVNTVIGDKEQLSIANFSGSSTQLIEMDKDLQQKCSLTNTHIKKLHSLGIRLEKYLKSPQDIEWAIKNDILYALQTRNITTLEK